MSEKVIAIIVAGGTGKRMNSALPKQFRDLAGKPVIVHYLEKFEREDNITAIGVACHKDYLSRMEGLISAYAIKKVRKLVPGGSTRQQSSYLGVKACPEGTEYVLIHDAVRPFVGDEIINGTLNAAVSSGASTISVEVKDTVIIGKMFYLWHS
jgi:2-C-methyl-D-erythritol 4-phosphate cytidylyltransferase